MNLDIWSEGFKEYYQSHLSNTIVPRGLGRYKVTVSHSKYGFVKSWVSDNEDGSGAQSVVIGKTIFNQVYADWLESIGQKVKRINSDGELV